MFSITGELIDFKAVKYIRDYDHNEQVLNNLKEERKEISYIRGQSSGPKVKSDRKHDGVEKISLLEIHLDSKIALYESYIKTYSRAMSALSSEERDILETMYRGHSSRPVLDLCRKYHIEQAYVYRRKNKAIEKFSELVVGKII